MSTTLTAALLVALLSLGACGGSDDAGSPSSSGTSSGSAPTSSPSTAEDSANAEDSDDARDDKAAKAISAFFLDAQKGGSGAGALLNTGRGDSDCIGDGMVDEIGVDRLQASGMLTDGLEIKQNLNVVKMTEDEAQATTDVLAECTDIAAMMKDVIDNDEGEPLPKNVRACIDKELTEENLRPVFVAVFQGKDAAAQNAFGNPLAACAKLARQ